MATTPPRRSAAPRRPTAPIGARPPGWRRRPRAALPAAAVQLAATPPPTDRWTRIQQAVGTLAALGTLAVIVFTWLSIQQVDDEHALTREGQVTDRYNNAVTNLGDKAPEVRLGGIYALQRIMEDSPRDQPSIVDVLSTYIRNHAEKPEKGTHDPQEPTTDVQAALTAVGTRDPAFDGSARVDFHGTNLAGVLLVRADLSGADLTGADLRNSKLSRANLGGATLSGADLRDALLDEADLRVAYLGDADLRGAILYRANVSGASLEKANLARADVSYANLNRASLPGVHLTRADLTRTNLEGVNLEGANLSYADLTRAKLTDAILLGADLRGADLYGANLEGAQR